MTCHLVINKAVMKYNCVEALNQHAQPVLLWMLRALDLNFSLFIRQMHFIVPISQQRQCQSHANTDEVVCCINFKTFVIVRPHSKRCCVICIMYFRYCIKLSKSLLRNSISVVSLFRAGFVFKSEHDVGQTDFLKNRLKCSDLAFELTSFLSFLSCLSILF